MKPAPVENLLKRFLRLSFLNIVANLSVPLAGLIDTAMLGHLPEIFSLAGVALGSIIFDYIYWTFGFLRMATTGLTAQAKGQKNYNSLYSHLYQGLFTGLVIALALLLLQPFIASLGLSLLSGEPTVKSRALEYFSWRIWGAPAVLMNFVFIGWFLGREESGRALFMTVAANLSNVLFNYVFIIRFGMGAGGAGIATMLSQYTMLMVAVLLFSIAPNKIFTAVWFFNKKGWLKIFKLNFDIMLRTVCLVFSFSVFTNFSSLLSVSILAANSILRDLMVFAAYLVDGSAFAVESLAGSLFAEKNRPELKRLVKLSLLASLVFALVFVAAIALFSESVFGMFTTHKNILRLLSDTWLWLAPILIVGSVAFTFDGLFLGVSQGRVLRNTMLASTFIFFLPMAFYARHEQSNDLLWFSLLLFMAARAMTTAVAARVFLSKEV